MTRDDHLREPAGPREPEGPLPVGIGLTAAIVADAGGRAADPDAPLPAGCAGAALPFGPFDPLQHRTLEIGSAHLGGRADLLDLGYAEQLYTFGDRGRHELQPGEGPRVVSVGYLALTRQCREPRRRPRCGATGTDISLGGLARRAARPSSTNDRCPRWRLCRQIRAGRRAPPRLRRERARLCFGLEAWAWDEEKVLERYELLYEAGLVEESAARRPRARRSADSQPLGTAMSFDHRRILATAIARLRGKMKYRPVVFELMPPSFTLLELQRTVEAISGIRLHKQNFRRLVETSAAVEPTGDVSLKTGGRPAALFHFRRNVLQEHAAPGLRVA